MTTLIISKGNKSVPADVLHSIKKNKGTIYIDTIRDIDVFDRADSILVIDNTTDWYLDKWIISSLDLSTKKKLKISFLSDK
jgi:hypothetical protein